MIWNIRTRSNRTFPNKVLSRFQCGALRETWRTVFPAAHTRLQAVLLTAGIMTFARGLAVAQVSEPAAETAVRNAVNSELNASKVDRSAWEYRDHDVQPGKDATYHIIETPKGDLTRLLDLNGHVLTGKAEQDELRRVHTFVNSPEQQEKKKEDSAHDGAQARELLSMLPNAFLWTIASQTPEETVLRFKPNPAFRPPDMQSRVMGIMAGEIVVSREGDRIRTLRGTLTQDVRIGFGILGKIDEGGTFDVERRQIAPGHWQITETHVHIGGHALLFKSIGQQEDQANDDFKPSTAPNLQVAEEQITR